MAINTENVIPWGIDGTEVFRSLNGLKGHGDTWLQLDFGFFKPRTEYMEKLDKWVSDDSDCSNSMKGILIATLLCLPLWTVIILALSKLL